MGTKCKGRRGAGEGKKGTHTIEPAGDGVIVLDDALIDEDPLGAGTGVDFDGVVGGVHGVDGEAVDDVGAAVEEQIALTLSASLFSLN